MTAAVFAWEATVDADTPKSVSVFAATIDGALTAVREKTPEGSIISCVRGARLVVRDGKYPLPRILTWVDKVHDPVTPGYVAHAITTTGEMLAHHAVPTPTVEHARRSVDAASRFIRAYEEAYPSGYEVVWIPEPDTNWELIAARLASEAPYVFEHLSKHVTKMRAVRGKRVIGYILFSKDLACYYATTSQTEPFDNEILPDPPYATPAAAAAFLHKSAQ